MPATDGMMRVLVRSSRALVPVVLALAVGCPRAAGAATCTPRVPTFLGNSRRCFHGTGPVPTRLDVIWKVRLGSGKTWVGGGFKPWSGNGWTGQPLIVEEDGTPFIIVGAYDHHLRKINGLTGEVIWKYRFDDVIKGTGTLYSNPSARSPEEQLIILQGSRRGNSKTLASEHVFSYRAISYATGRELWRMNVPRTGSYSRDVDGSALALGGLAYLGAENGIFYVLDPDPAQATVRDGALQPKILKQRRLYSEDDAARHGGDLAIESSPALCGDRIIVTAGSGHVFGMDPETLEIAWDFFIGSDLNGSPVVTRDGCVLVTVEKQFISGRGGVFKLDPQKPPNAEAVWWYFPVGDRRFATWQGGVVGSASVNDSYNPRGRKPCLAAFSAVAGRLYVVSHISRASETVRGPRSEGPYRTPREIFSANIGGAISTPVFCGDDTRDWVVAAGYNGVYLFQLDYLPARPDDPEALWSPDGRLWRVKVTQLDHFAPGISFEATPVVWKGMVYVGARDGWLYALGDQR